MTDKARIKDLEKQLKYEKDRNLNNWIKCLALTNRLTEVEERPVYKRHLFNTLIRLNKTLLGLQTIKDSRKPQIKDIRKTLRKTIARLEE